MVSGWMVHVRKMTMNRKLTPDENRKNVFTVLYDGFRELNFAADVAMYATETWTTSRYSINLHFAELSELHKTTNGQTKPMG